MNNATAVHRPWRSRDKSMLRVSSMPILPSQNVKFYLKGDFVHKAIFLRKLIRQVPRLHRIKFVWVMTHQMTLEVSAISTSRFHPFHNRIAANVPIFDDSACEFGVILTKEVVNCRPPIFRLLRFHHDAGCSECGKRKVPRLEQIRQETIHITNLSHGPWPLGWLRSVYDSILSTINLLQSDCVIATHQSLCLGQNVLKHVYLMWGLPCKGEHMAAAQLRA